MKRGVSPVISTVLVIAFLVVIFLLVSNWVQTGIVGETVDKTEERVTKEFECGAIIIDVKDGCISDALVNLNVDVKSDEGVSGVVVRAIGKNGDVGTGEYDAENVVVAPSRLVSMSTEIDLDTAIADIDEIEVYPKSESGETCNTQVDKLRDVEACT